MTRLRHDDPIRPILFENPLGRVSRVVLRVVSVVKMARAAVQAATLLQGDRDVKVETCQIANALVKASTGLARGPRRMTVA